MRIAVAQLGARMHYAVPRIFHEAGMLERLFTDSYVGNKPWLEAGLKAIPKGVRPRGVERWLGRKEAAIPPAKVTSFETFGLSYVRAQRRAADNRARSKVFCDYGRRFSEQIIRHGIGAADTVWGFNGASLELFRFARSRGVRTILEQTMAPRRSYVRLMRAEAERWPGWQPGLVLPDDMDELMEREEAEWERADLIVCGSQFVVDEIAKCGGPAGKCRVVPYGVDLTKFPVRERPALRDPSIPLRVLFAGEVGLRKGAPLLLEALRRLGPEEVRARFAGPIALAREKLAAYRDVASFPGPVPRRAMVELFSWADVLVLPSVCEGSATVTYEAAASGMPVICTPNTGALESEMVHVAPSLDASCLAEAIAGMRMRRFDDLDVIRNRYGMDAYRDRLLAVLPRQAAH